MKRSATARCSAWDEATLRTRIIDTDRRLRRAASSPNAEEIEVFRRMLESGGPPETVLVLGMTPELRRLALQHARRVYSVDDSKTSIDLFRSWVDRADRRRERIIRDRKSVV